MSEFNVLDPVALGERLTEHRLTLAAGIDALKKITDPQAHEILDTIELLVRDDHDLMLIFAEGWKAEREHTESFLTRIKDDLTELRQHIPEQGGSA